MAAQPQVREAAERVEALLGEIEQLEDPAARETATGAVQALISLYGDGLERILERVGPELRAELAADEAVGHLLLIHDLHPEPLSERIGAALDEVRPYLESHGGGVELLEVGDAIVRLRLEGSCNGCPSSALTLKHAVEDMIRRRAPEIETVEAEGLADETAPPPQGLLQIEGAVGGDGSVACPTGIDGDARPAA